MRGQERVDDPLAQRVVDRELVHDAREKERAHEQGGCELDVHVRRLRAKLGRYEEIVRTVRGVGYRFDRHADVAIRYASTPSPDLF